MVSNVVYSFHCHEGDVYDLGKTTTFTKNVNSLNQTRK